MKRAARATTRTVRRVAVAVGGAALLTLGVALLVLPGPAIVVIPAGLGLLALEFDTPRRWRDWLLAASRSWRTP